MMKSALLSLCSLLILTGSGCSTPPSGDSPWISLFDGQTLQGWHALPGGFWQVDNGAILGTSPQSDPRHGILLTDARYRDFTLRFQYQVLQGNSGLYFRVDPVANELSVNGLQAEIDVAKDAGGLYETGGREWVVKPDPAEVQKYFKPGQWNEMTITARGRHITVFVNGYKTADLPDDPGRLEGHIGLQLHGGMDMNVRFKDLKIKIL